MEKGLKLVLFVSVLFLSMQFISADATDVTVSPTSVSAGINQNYDFSITMSNAYIDGVAPNNGTITQVVFTLPSGMTFVSGTSSSNPSSIFSSSSNTLTWMNSSFVVNLGSSTIFAFTANTTANGTITIVSTLANTTTTTDTIDVTVSDSSVPVVNLVSPDNNADDTDGVLVFECNATDNIAVSSIKLSITSNGSEIYSNIANFSGTSAQRQSEWDYTFSNAGTYKWNCFANDTGGSSVWGINRTLTISALSSLCSPNWNFSAWDDCLNGTQTRTVTDLNSCGTTSGKPAESQECVLSICTADWTCNSWSPTECPQNGTQKRICTDNNSCLDAAGKPSEGRTCTPSGGNAWIFITIILILVLGGGAAALIFYLRNKNPSENMPQDNSGNQQRQDYGYSYQ